MVLGYMASELVEEQGVERRITALVVDLVVMDLQLFGYPIETLI